MLDTRVNIPETTKMARIMSTRSRLSGRSFIRQPRATPIRAQITVAAVRLVFIFNFFFLSGKGGGDELNKLLQNAKDAFALAVFLRLGDSEEFFAVVEAKSFSLERIGRDL